jgi:hypothetical protein
VQLDAKRQRQKNRFPVNNQRQLQAASKVLIIKNLLQLFINESLFDGTLGN